MEHKKIKILAIDDNRDNLIALKAIISEVFPQSVVYLEESGHRGIETARYNDPDVILLDIVMPGMDGYQVCKMLKADEQLPEIPVIFLTALNGDKHSRILALEAGGEAFLVKPVDSTELKAQILAMLKIREAAAYKRDKRLQLEELVKKRTEELNKANTAALNLLEDLQKENQQRKESEEALRESERKYAFLAGTAFDLVKFTSIQKIYEYTARKLFELLEENGIVAVVEYDADSNRWKMQYLEGIHDKLDDLVRIFGFDVRKLEGNISTKYYDIILSGKIEEVAYDFPGLFNNKVSDQIGRTVKKLLSIDKIYCITFKSNKQIFGNITLATKKNAKPLNVELIEAFVMQVTNFIKKQKSEEALRQKEEKLQSIFRVAPTGIGVVSNRMLIEVNPRVCEMTGYSPEELIGQSSRILYPSQEEFEFVGQEKYAQIAKQGTGMVETRWQRKNGTVLDILLASTPIDPQNKSQGVIFTALDITERKQAEKKLKLLNHAVESSSVSVIITDALGHIHYVNPYFTEHTGYSSEDVFGKRLRILNTGKLSVSDHEELWSNILSGKEWVGEYQNRKKNGEPYWENAVISPILNKKGKVINFVAINEDITEKKKILEELFEAKEKAEESDRLKSAFLANMSHEIRTPMNGILGFAGLLKEPKLSGEQQQKYIQIIEKSGTRMLSIINDIVNISKIESGLMDVHLSEININSQLQFVYDVLKFDADNKNLNLSFHYELTDKEAIIKTDNEKFFGILSNLVKNAIKYTDSGTIEYGYNIVETHGRASLQFYVKDTGIGIPKDRQETIFERFIQADIADKMARQGAGLGLAISKAYVEMLGGKIWVESEVGKGSTFYFTLPYHQDEPAQETIDRQPEPSEQHDAIRKLKILMVEDDEVSQMLLDETVKMSGKEILKARTGVEAVEACRNNPDIDLILMDIQMPDLDGYEATRQIRKFNKEVVIIAQTAYGLTGDREKSIEAGCNDYMVKPIKKIELQALIHQYFGK